MKRTTIGIFTSAFALALVSACSVGSSSSVSTPTPEDLSYVTEIPGTDLQEVETSAEMAETEMPGIEPVEESEEPEGFHVHDGPVDHISVARKQISEGKLDEAVVELSKQLFDDPDSFEAYYLMGETFQKKGDLDQAIWSFSEASSLRSDDLDVLTTLTRLQLDAGQLGEAEVSARRMIELEPSNPEGHRLLARTFSKRNMWNETIASNEKAIFLGDDSAYTYNNKGYAELVTGRYDDAIDSFQNAVTKKGATHFMWNNLGIALEKSGRLAEAHGAYQKALEVSPKYVNAKVNLDRLVTVAEAEGIVLGDRVADLDEPVESDATEDGDLIDFTEDSPEGE